MAEREPHHTCFGIWSAAKAQLVSRLLSGLGVRFYFSEEKIEQERLEAWFAWDPAATNPEIGHHLWIRADDLPIVDSHIVDMFPERQFNR